MTTNDFNMGMARRLDGGGAIACWDLPPHHLVTHGVVVGMTGSGKTGLITVTLEEALRAGVPCLVIDVKGDLPNLLLAPPLGDPGALAPWLPEKSDGDARSLDERAAAATDQRDRDLAAWHLTPADVARFRATTRVRVITPGSTAGEPLHVLSSLERRSPLWESDPESARAALSAAVSLVLRLLGRDPDPARSREHVLLAVLAERRLRAGQSADLASLLGDLEAPPIAEIGALTLEAFLPKKERRALSVALNTLLASPTFETWRQGTTLDVGAWLTPTDGRTPAVVVSVAHLDDDERALVLGVLLEETLAWVRSLPGTQRLRALVVFDEVYGFLPPHPANPPTKRPIIALMKQARAFGVGVVLATQNPMDLDYRSLGNAGVWCIGRLQTDADRARVIDGLTGGGGTDRAATRRLAETIGNLAPRWFVYRDAHVGNEPFLVQPRDAITLLRGPMTRGELRAARGEAEVPREADSGVRERVA